MKTRLLFTILIAFVSLSGCAVWAETPPGAEDKPSYPLESFPETSMDTIDPFSRPESVVVATQIASFPKDNPEKTNLDSTLVEDELLALINEARGGGSIAMLESEETMLWAARLRSIELHESFSHSRADGKAYYTVFDEVGFSYSGKWHGENAASLTFAGDGYDEKEIARLMYEDLAKSPGHSRNMLRSQYKQIGVGVAIKVADGETRIMSSQLFASK